MNPILYICAFFLHSVEAKEGCDLVPKCVRSDAFRELKPSHTAH